MVFFSTSSTVLWTRFLSVFHWYTDCTGDQVPASSQRECCVETDTGLSYNDGGTCTVCIGM